MSQEVENTVKEQVKLTVSGILNDLENGLIREQIQDKYGLSGTDVTKLFKHPKLKNKKAKKAPGFILEDDTAEENAEPALVAQSAVQETSTPQTGDKWETVESEVAQIEVTQEL